LEVISFEKQENSLNDTFKDTFLDINVIFERVVFF